VGAWGVVINRLAAVRDTTGKVLIIWLVKVEAIRRHEYDIRYCSLNETPEWRTKERLAEMRTLGGNASFSAEYTDGLIRSGHVLTTNTCWGYDYKGERSMTVKGLVTMVAAPMFSARTLSNKAQRIPLHVEWLPIHLPAINEGDDGRISKVISAQASVYRYWRRLRYRYWRCFR
jgi:hypothetical protein